MIYTVHMGKESDGREEIWADKPVNTISRVAISRTSASTNTESTSYSSFCRIFQLNLSSAVASSLQWQTMKIYILLHTDLTNASQPVNIIHIFMGILVVLCISIEVKVKYKLIWNSQ